MKKPWLEHSSKWEVPWDERPEHNCNLNMFKGVNPTGKLTETVSQVADNVSKLPKELFFCFIGTGCFAGFILYLFSTAVK